MSMISGKHLQYYSNPPRTLHHFGIMSDREDESKTRYNAIQFYLGKKII